MKRLYVYYINTLYYRHEDAYFLLYFFTIFINYRYQNDSTLSIFFLLAFVSTVIYLQNIFSLMILNFGLIISLIDLRLLSSLHAIQNHSAVCRRHVAKSVVSHTSTSPCTCTYALGAPKHVCTWARTCVCVTCLTMIND